MIKAKVGDTVRITSPDEELIVHRRDASIDEWKVHSVDEYSVFFYPSGYADHGYYEIISTADQSTPPHYAEKNGVACIDAIRAQLGRDGFIALCRGNIAKYNWRLLDKGDPKENADKLADYALMLAKELETAPNGVAP